MTKNDKKGRVLNAQVIIILIELLSIAALLCGVALIHVPSALILGGALGILGAELNARARNVGAGT